MRKSITFIILFTLALTGAQAQQDLKKEDKKQDTQMKAFENMIDDIFKGFFGSDSLNPQTFMSEEFMIDTSFFNSLFNDQNMSLMLEGFFPQDIDTTALNEMFNQSLRMLDSMDEEQMRSLLDAFDFNQMDDMFKGFDFGELENLMKDMDLKIPESYMDSIGQSLKEKQEKSKNLKRI